MTFESKKYLLAFNKPNIKDIRRVLNAIIDTLDDNYDFAKAWINYIIYSILRQYEAGNTVTPKTVPVFASFEFSMIFKYYKYI